MSKKKPLLVYIDPVLQQKLKMYCARKSKLIREAVSDMLTLFLKDEIIPVEENPDQLDMFVTPEQNQY